MLTWSTQFPLRFGCSTSDVIALANKWIRGSPHSNWSSFDFAEDSTKEIQSFEQSGQKVWIARYSEGPTQWAGFRYLWTDSENLEWRTDIVARQSATEVVVTVQVHCEAGDIGRKIPRPKKPYIVRQLLEDLGGGLDEGLLVSDQPVYLAEAEVGKAAGILGGHSNNYLPVIYLSATWSGRPAVNPITLAQWASGMAHVVVEPSRHFSFALARATNRSNPYAGAIGICWPRGDGNHVRLAPVPNRGPEWLASLAAQVVREALTTCRTDSTCTWDYVEEKISHRRIETLRKSGDQELNKYIEAFDSEARAKDNRIQQMEQELQRLRSELLASTRRSRVEQGRLLTPPDVQELYAGELYDATIYALSASIASLMPTGRTKELVDLLLEKNISTGERERIEDGIRSALQAAEEIGKRERKTLEDLGFSISEEGKHLKMVFGDNDKYVFTAAKTGSDWRGMKNQTSDIIKRLFK